MNMLNPLIQRIFQIILLFISLSFTHAHAVLLMLRNPKISVKMLKYE